MRVASSAISFVGALTIALLSSAACVPGSDCLEGKPCTRNGYSTGDDEADAAAAGDEETPFVCSEVGRPHIGLGGVDVAAQNSAPPHADRARAKPYSALVTEYSRVLGEANRPALIDETGGTFGIAADRWYLEPLASAVFINTAFNVAFEGCLKMTGDLPGGSGSAAYAVMPTAESARVECASWIRRFWSREASPEQIDACAAVALETTTETYDEATTRDVTPKRRWAYACASVLSGTGFLMY